ncbi:hypothetical protein ACFX1R_032481 [Malus domestica]
MDDILNISIVKIYRKEHGITSFNSNKTEINSDHPPLKSNNDKDKDTPCFPTVLLLPLWTLPPDIKLIRTDTTLDLSQKAEKGSKEVEDDPFDLEPIIAAVSVDLKRKKRSYREAVQTDCTQDVEVIATKSRKSFSIEAEETSHKGSPNSQ